MIIVLKVIVGLPSSFGYFTILNYQNAISMCNGRQPVCHFRYMVRERLQKQITLEVYEIIYQCYSYYIPFKIFESCF